MFLGDHIEINPAVMLGKHAAAPGRWAGRVQADSTATTARVSVSSDGSQGNGGSEYPSISAGGRYVAFASWASNLVGGDTNGRMDVFVLFADLDFYDNY